MHPLAMKALRMMLSLTLAAALVLGGITLFQDRMLYFPAPASVAQLETAQLRAWPSAGDMRGLLAQPAEPARATAIVFHGNAGHAGHRAFYVAMLAPHGIRVILAKYPGYGPRGGALGEDSLVADAVQSIELAHRDFGAPLLVIGESLGAGVAAAAAAKARDKVAGLLLLTPWDRLESVASHHYPLLPVKWLLRDRYDSAANLAGFGRPVVVAVAEHDSIVPPQFGKALFAALGEPKRLLVVAGAEHNDWPERVDARWWASVLEFLLGPKP